MLENNPVLLNSLFFALMAAVTLLLIFLVVKGILASRRWKSALEAPITEEFATVVGKEETEKTRRAMGLTSFEAEQVTGYLVTFLRERDDIRQTVPVEESFYHAVAEGDRGILWMRGNTFIKFERTKE